MAKQVLKKTNAKYLKVVNVSNGKVAKKKNITKKALVKKAVVNTKTLKTASPVKTAKKVVKEPKVVKKVVKKVSSGPKGYTPAQYTTFKELKADFNAKSNQVLKDLLRKNCQSMSGSKDELVYKCADGAVLGRIPRCPKCYGGRPKFDFQKGTYYCSGYRDDVDFKNCHTSFNTT
jgi:hypothetical protein